MSNAVSTTCYVGCVPTTTIAVPPKVTQTNLAFTGFDITGFIMAAVALIVLGGSLITGSRKRRRGPLAR